MKNTPCIHPQPQRLSLWVLLLLCCTTGALAHYTFYLLAPAIWSQGVIFPIERFTSWTRFYAMERDGIEVYALYIAMFLQGALLLSSITVMRSLQITNFRFLWVIYTVFTIISVNYLLSMGFNPPMSDFHDISIRTTLQQILNFFPGFAVMGMCFYLTRNRAKLTNAIAAIILIPICFISTGPAYLPDYGYIFAPALQLIHGVNLSEIYFQYDLLLSLIAILTLNCENAVESLQIAGQISLYFLLVGALFFSRDFFLNKRNYIILIICMVIARIYAGEHHILASFQVTPLRLDLWLVILATAYYFGISHWMTGATISLFIIFHRNFGIIYFLAYLQLLVLMFLIEIHEASESKSGKCPSAKDVFCKYISTYKLNLILSITALVIAILVLGNNGAYRYQSIGIGFLRIASSSFFWYIAILLLATFGLLLQMRNNIPRRYFVCSCFLILLAVGNSLYFFGRSHENNIINISAIYLFVLFLFIDCLQFHIESKYNHKLLGFKISLTASFGILLILTSLYANNISNKVARQLLNASSRQFIYPNSFSKVAMQENISNIKSATSDSKKVYFVSSIDYLYYIYGNFRPVGYYNPFLSWVLQDEMAVFINSLIQSDYYIVIDNINLIKEIVPHLKFGYSSNNGSHLVLHK